MKKISCYIIYICFLFVILTNAQVKDKPFAQEYHKPYPLSTEKQNDVRAITVDNDDDVWAGTKAGLFKFNKLTREWSSTLDSSNQGPMNDLFVDSDGTLWVAAWNGVYAIEKSKATKIKNIIGPIGAISEIEGSIVAIGTNGIWLKDNENWKKEPITYSKAI